MTAATQNWRIAPGDPTHVFFDGVAKPINCGTAERARLIAAAPTMREYIQKRADDGCGEAATILEALNAGR